MTVLHVSRTMGQGGAEKIVFQLCRDNVGIHQMVASTGGIYAEELERREIRHFRIPDIDRKSPFVIIRTFFTLWSVICKNKVDIIHTHHRMAAFYAHILQLFNRRVRHMYTAHNVFYGKQRLMRFALKGAEIIAVGESVKRNLISEYRIPAAEISIIYNAVDTSRVTDYKNKVIEELVNGGNYVIGTIGRLSDQKGMDIFIRAVGEALKNRPDLKAVIVGDGELKEQMRKLVLGLGLEDTVYFLGYQSHVPEIIRQLQFVVSASRWEGLPLTLIEAFSQGKTVIATDIPGNNEVVEDGKNGILVAAEDYREMADRIVRLAKDTAEKAELEHAALEVYQGKYRYENFQKSYMLRYMGGGK